jgi:hypothetical protein
VKLGNPNGASHLKGLGNKAAIQAIQDASDKRARSIVPLIGDIRGGGITSFRGIAGELNKRGILTARGGKWHATSVSRIIKQCE